MTCVSISPEELLDLQAEQQVDLIDVRTPAEFGEVHAQGARNVPLSELKPAELMKSRNGTTGQPLYVMCRTGNRAAKACQKLTAAGYADVATVAGGVAGWEAAGLPTVRGKKAISLERQVRIVAGLLVLLGAILGYFVNIHFVWLPAFIGAGLMFAGITDTCGMAMMLAKMPWNQRAGDQPSASDQQCAA
jgi:rhodanese-related sulfurtransferase